MTNKLHVFVSSVQKELEDERVIVQNLLNTDSFLSVHCVPETRLLVTPAIETRLNERQRKALSEVVESGFVSSGWLVKRLGVTYDTANRDLKALAGMKILVRKGRGRAAKYILAEQDFSQ